MNAVVLSVSGTTVTPGTPVNLGSTPYELSVAGLDGSNAIFVYSDGTSAYPTAAVISVSGTTPTLNSTTVLESAQTVTSDGAFGQRWVTAIDGTTAAACWMNQAQTDFKTCAMSISGTTVTAGSVVTLDSTLTSGGGWTCAICAPTASRLVFGYTDYYLSPWFQYFLSATVAGTTITSNADKTASAINNTYLVGITALGTGFFAAYSQYVSSGNYALRAAVEATTDTRNLDLSADFDNLYATKLVSGTLTLLSYDHATLTETTVDTFGSCSNADIDAGTNALKVTVLPADSVIYLWGYDGNGVQVQRSTDGGASWTDLSGSWTTAVVNAFEVDIFNSADIVAALSNDDIYHTIDGGVTWSQTGNAPGGDAATAERHPIYPSALMVASTGAGDLDVTPDYGATWGTADISGGGTITVIKKAL